MGRETKIEWTDHTFSPWRGCTEAQDAAGVQHPACDNCYAKAMAKRNPSTLGVWGDVAGGGTRVVAAPAYWRQPLKWDRDAKKAGVRRRVFCASISDVFEDWTGPIVDSQGRRLLRTLDGRTTVDPNDDYPEALTMSHLRADLFRLIDATPNLDWLLLTKRPENVRRMWRTRDECKECDGDGRKVVGWNADAHENEEGKCECHRPNVWLGTSIADQATYDVWMPRLLESWDLAPVLFLSIEPLVGPIDLGLDRIWCRFHRRFESMCMDESQPCFREQAMLHDLITWIIAGGESQAHARPTHPDWARSLRDQAVAAGVAFFFKQWGEYITFEQITTDAQRDAWSRATLAGRQSYFGYRVVPGPQGLKTDVTPGIRPASFAYVGKAAAGRLLDGREWSEFPAFERQS